MKLNHLHVLLLIIWETVMDTNSNYSSNLNENVQRVFSPKDAAKYLGCCVTSLYRYMKIIPNFPQGVKLTAGKVVFFKDDLDAYLDAAKRAANAEA